MEVIFSPQSLEDLQFWKQSGNMKIQKRIQTLLESIMKTPFDGIGRPEALKHNWTGYWSRRINQEHRMIYKIDNGKVFVAQMRSHY